MPPYFIGTGAAASPVIIEENALKCGIMEFGGMYGTMGEYGEQGADKSMVC
jgi:hypothetical protein